MNLVKNETLKLYLPQSVELDCFFRLDSLSTIILDDQCSSKYSSFNKLLMQRLRTASQASPSEQRAKDEHAR